MAQRFITTLIGLAAASVIAASASAAQKTWHIGFLEAGPYPAHSELRKHFSEQLPGLLPDGCSAVTVPHGFKSGDWARESCRRLAAELKADTSIHMVVTTGPWAVEDLLAVGYDRPIVAMYRLDPVAEGLVDTSLRPIAPNLTVRVRPGSSARISSCSVRWCVSSGSGCCHSRRVRSGRTAGSSESGWPADGFRGDLGGRLR